MDKIEMPSMPKEATKSQRAENIFVNEKGLENKVKEMNDVSIGSLVPSDENVKNVKDIIAEFERRSQPHCVKEVKVPLEIDEDMIDLTEIPENSYERYETNDVWNLVDDAREFLEKINDLSNEIVNQRNELSTRTVKGTIEFLQGTIESFEDMCNI